MKKTFHLIVAMGLALATAFVNVTAQTSSKVYRVGLLVRGEVDKRFADPLIRGLAQSGYVLGRNLALETRDAQYHVERLPQLVDELVASKVDVIVSIGYPAARAAKQRAGTVPVVIFGTGDPVASGLVDSLARPGGNLTGTSDLAAELAPKRLQLLKEVRPQLRRVAIIWNTGDLGMTLRYEASAASARLLGIVIQPLGVSKPEDFEDAFATMTRDPPDAIFIVADWLTNLNRKSVIEIASVHQLPSMYEAEPSVTDGGLMSYSGDPNETFERLTSIVDRVLKGARPKELPFEQPTRFRLVVNLKTAKALGIKIPQSILLRADRVIE